MATSYPTPARSVGTGGRLDETDNLVWERGSTTGELSDGRPFLAEIWSESELTFVSFFFSSLDIEEQSAEQLTDYLMPQLDQFEVPPQFRHGSGGAKIIEDDAGQSIWSVTYCLIFE